MTKKLLVFVFALVLLTTFVAADWNDISTYDEITDTVTIHNWFGLGAENANYTLLENTGQCLGLCSAVGESYLNQGNRPLFESMTFINHNGEEEYPNYKWYLLDDTPINYSIPQYRELCEISLEGGNGTSCSWVEDGFEYELIPNEAWVEYDGSDLDAGYYKWKIEGIKSPNQEVDWIVEVFGNDIEEWAWWDSDWDFKKEITLTESNVKARTFEPVEVNLTGLKLATDNCSKEIRITNELDVEIPVQILDSGGQALGDGDDWCKVLFIANATMNGDTSYYTYYGNAAATVPDYSSLVDLNITAVSGAWDIYNGNIMASGGAGTLTGYVNLNGTGIDRFWSMNVHKGSFVWIGTNTGYGCVSDTMTITENGLLRKNITCTSEVDANYGVSYLIYDKTPYIKTNFKLDPADSVYIDFDIGEQALFEKYQWNSTTTGNVGIDSGVVTGTGTDSLWNTSDTEMMSILFDTSQENSIADVNFPTTDGYYSCYTGASQSCTGVNNLVYYHSLDTPSTQGFTEANKTRATILTHPLTTTMGVELGNVFAPDITLYTPAANYRSNISTLTTVAQTQDGNGIQNVTLWVDDVLNQTNSSGMNNTNYTFTTELGDGTHTWLYVSCDITGLCQNSSTRTFYVDTVVPTITINAPTGVLDYGVYNQNMVLNITATDANLDKCWFERGGVNTTFACSTGAFADTTTTISEREYDIIFWANDTTGWNISSSVSTGYRLMEYSKNYNTTTIETYNESFVLNVSANSTLTAVAIDWNGTDYSLTSASGNYSTTLDVPTSKLQNNSIRWKYTYGGATIYSPYFYQNVSLLNFTHCSATNPYRFLNWTFKNEDNSTSIPASLSSSTFNYWLGNGGSYKTYTYSNVSENFYYEFCSSSNSTLNMNYSVSYKKSDYPQRNKDTVAQPYSNSSTNETLYLLYTDDGIYVTFQVINSAEQVISGVVVNGTIDVGGVDTLIVTGTTNAGGVVTFWLDPNTQHTMTFTADGYDQYSTTLYPTENDYTITLGGSVSAGNDYSRGITQAIYPKGDELLQNTDYVFNYTLTSDYWTVVRYGLSITNSTSTIYSTEASTNGGTLSNTINVSANDFITYNYWYLINDTFSNYSKSYYLYNQEGTGFGVKQFADNLETHLDSGIFGLDDFGLAVILFLLIFIFTGIISYQFGLQSPAAISAVVFAMVALLDAGLGLMDGLRPAGVNFPIATSFIGLIMIILIIREATR